MNDKAEEEYSCAYPLKSRLTVLDADRIAQASVYLADHIYLPVTAALDPSASAEDQRYVHKRLSELKDIGAVKLWQIEGGLSISSHESKAVAGTEDILIDRAAYADLYGQVMSRLVTNRAFFRGSDAFDGIAEVVEGKNALFLFALKDMLGAKALLLDDRMASNMSKYFTTLTQETVVAEDVIKRLVVRLHLPDIAELQAEQIELLRQYMPTFRAKLLAAVGDQQLLFYEREEMVERITDLLIDDFFEYVASLRKRDNRKQRYQERRWSFLQLMLAPILAQSNAKRFFGWSGSSSTAPEMMLLELHRFQSKKRSGGTAARKE